MRHEEEIQIRTQVVGRKENWSLTQGVSSKYCHEWEELVREKDVTFLNTCLEN